MSSRSIAASRQVHRNQQKHFQFSGMFGNALSLCHMSWCPKPVSPLLGDMLYFLQIALTQMAKVAMNRLIEMKDKMS